MRAALARISWRQTFAQAGILATLALLPVWYRLPARPLDFADLYVSRFLILLPLLWTVAWWLLAGLPGWRTLLHDRERRIWAGALLLLSLWAFGSQTWAFVRAEHPELAASAALQLGGVILFAIVVSCIPPQGEQVAAVLTLSLIGTSLLVFLQAAHQQNLGLQAIGEFPFTPDAPGYSILMAGDLRWMRPYGLLPHPNMLGGFLAIGILAACTWLFSPRRGLWLLGLLAVLAGMWALLLTFSRAAWLGLAGGLLAALLLLLPRLWRNRTLRRRALVAVTALVGLGIAFAVLYWPFLTARAGVGEENVELRSISDRLVFTHFAERAIAENPIIGVGIANFPWRTSYYLLETDYDLTGNNVHNVYLLIWAELGIVGLGFFGVALIAWAAGFWRRYRQGQLSPAQILLACALIVLAIIGLLDHYPWTTLHFQIAWWALPALGFTAAARPESRIALN